MVQLAAALELILGGVTYTLSVGWGTASVPGHQTYVPLFGLFNQKAVGARRYGVVVLGLYVTLQMMDVAKAAADMQRQMAAGRTNGMASPTTRVLRNSTALASVGAMPQGPVKIAPPKSGDDRRMDVV